MSRAAGLLTAVAVVGTLGCISDAAFAADRSWSGFYIGPNLGVAWSDVGKTLSTPGVDATPPYFYASDAAAIQAAGRMGWDEAEVSVGGQAGYNVQLGAFVVGAEVDIGRLGLNARETFVGPTPLASDVTIAANVKANYLATLRGRLGITAGRGLFYVTGGLAYSRVSFSQSTTFAVVPTVDDASDASHRFGWTIGGGAEFALQGGWTIKAEYLYADLGSFDTTTNPASPYGAGTVPFRHSVDLTAQIARVGLNYGF